MVFLALTRRCVGLEALDREFLFSALAQFGFDAALVQLIRRLHANTTARFLVNGDLSRAVPVATGIRQGCPLAPLLFLIAVELLKYAIDETPGLRGISLRGAGKTITHNWSAFVDDSVVFLEQGSMLPSLLATLQEFAAVSGLQIQPAKSHLILLNARCTQEFFCGFPVLQPGDTIRYLGVLIGLGDLAEPNWMNRLGKVKHQLGIAARFVASIPDRVEILNAVAIPSLLFTAKYYTPSPTILKELDQIWKQYIWQGTISSRPLRAHKITMSILTLPTEEMGLGVQDPRAAMVAQAARCVLEWNTKSQDKPWRALHHLLCAALGSDPEYTLHTYPTATASNYAPTVSGKTELLALGWRLVLQHTRERYPLPDHLRDRRQHCIQALPKAAACLQWLSSQVGQFCVPPRLHEQWQDVTRRNYAAMAPEIRAYWQSFPWADNAWVINADGHALAKHDHPQLSARCIGEVQLQYTGNATFRFNNPWSSQQPPPKAQLERVAQWIWTLIVNTGLHPEEKTSYDGSERVYSIQHHCTFAKYEWTINTAGQLEGRDLDRKWSQRPCTGAPASIMGQWSAWGKPVEFTSTSGTGRAAADLTRLQSATDGTVLLAGHPTLHHGPVLIQAAGSRRRELGRQDLKRALRLPRDRVVQLRQTAATLLCNRLQRTYSEHPGVFGALQSATPSQFAAHTDGLSLYQQLFRYRLVIGALNTRNNEGRPMACPHQFCSSTPDPVQMSHIVWDCVGAQRVWREVLTRWTARPVPTLTDYVYDCFRPAAPVLARVTRQALAATELTWQIQQTAVKQVWKVLTTVVAHQLWLSRNSACFQDKSHSIDGLAAQVWATFAGQTQSLARRYNSDDNTASVGDCVRVLLDQLKQPTTVEAAQPGNVRLYYDGGARGNPGSSGAGSVLVESDGDTGWSIVWWCATYCGRSQTNNYAEHVGLATGLAECATRYGKRAQSIMIIGDSALVTNQIHGRAAVTHPKLLPPAAQSMFALNELYTYECAHTRRAGNKMADLIANEAMDAATSSSWDAATDASPNAITTQLYGLLEGDIAAPTNDLRPQPTMEPTIRQRYHIADRSRPDAPEEPPTKKTKPAQDSID